MLNQKYQYEDLKNLWNKTFSGDYSIVGHPETALRNFFEAPNAENDHGRQYNLTVFGNLSEAEFKQKLAQVKIVAVFCMDRDVVLPAYKQLLKEYRDDEIMLVTVAGGIVQASAERQTALSALFIYLNAQKDKSAKILATGHNQVCGYVKFVLGQSLPEKLGGTAGDDKENKAMKALIAHSAGVLLPEMNPELVLTVIDRQGNVRFDRDFTRIEPQALKQL